MKVVCIEPFYWMWKGRPEEGIRYGISYDVVSRAPFGGGIKIINDFGKQHTYKESRFITIEEWRERQLNEIGL
jgi:hypothetical protein